MSKKPVHQGLHVDPHPLAEKTGTQAVEEFGGIDVLINLAAFHMELADIEDLTPTGLPVTAR